MNGTISGDFFLICSLCHHFYPFPIILKKRHPPPFANLKFQILRTHTEQSTEKDISLILNKIHFCVFFLSTIMHIKGAIYTILKHSYRSVKGYK